MFKLYRLHKRPGRDEQFFESGSFAVVQVLTPVRAVQRRRVELGLDRNGHYIVQVVQRIPGDKINHVIWMLLLLKF